MTGLGEAVGEGRYRLLERLGGGRDRDTFLAKDQRSALDVIVKRFCVKHAQSWKEVELAEREARVLRGIHHELLPEYIDHFEEEGCLYTVVTHVPGEDLRAARRAGRHFGEAEIFALLSDAARAFEYLHRQTPPIVHRDLEPGNIVLGPDGRYRFVDFGAVAQRLRGEEGSTVAGTFGYMAPEQLQGRAAPAADIYALGATAMALLTGTEPDRLPYVGLAIDVQRALGDTTSERLREILEAMLEPDPELRASDLGQLLESPQARSQRSSASAKRSERGAFTSDRAPVARRRRGSKWLVLLLLTALLLVTGYALLRVPVALVRVLTLAIIGYFVFLLVRRPRAESSARGSVSGDRRVTREPPRTRAAADANEDEPSEPSEAAQRVRRKGEG